MSSIKSNLEGLNVVECKHVVGGKNAPIRYIPEQDPVQDALEKTKKITYFKLTLPNNVNELKLDIWTSGPPEQFLLHVHTSMHLYKQLDLETEEDNAMMALQAAYCKLDAAKAEYSKLAKEAKQKAKDVRDRDQNPSPESQKKAREPKDKTNMSAPDIIANAAAFMLPRSMRRCGQEGRRSKACCCNGQGKAI